MAIIVKTTRPYALLAAIREAMDEKKIRLWQHDDDGDFTRSDDKWRHRAWLRPMVREDRVIFRIFPRTDKAMSKIEYAVYHARFIEMLLRYFDGEFSEAIATALPRYGDRVAARTSEQ